MFRNLPPVTKNILILNVLFYLGSVVLQSSGIPAFDYLSGRYLNAPFFEPYQIVTHMFMHSQFDPLHIFFNMFLLLMFGAHLENVWGGKRFFIFYFACGLGAFLLYNVIGYIQIMELKSELAAAGFDIGRVDRELMEHRFDSSISFIEFGEKALIPDNQALLSEYYNYAMSSLVGASGAIFGLLAGFAMLFPNTELQIIFLPIRIKAKWLIGGYLAYEVYATFFVSGDQIAHLAHVGGAIVGIVLVLIWRRFGKQFY